MRSYLKPDKTVRQWKYGMNNAKAQRVPGAPHAITHIAKARRQGLPVSDRPFSLQSNPQPYRGSHRLVLMW